jgi:outer membrane biosynthesis protein TonB
VLLHAAVLVWLLSRPVPAPTAAKPAELLLVEVTLPPPPPPTAEEPPPPPKPVEPPKVRAPKAPAIARVEPAEETPPPAEEPPPIPEVSDAPVDDAPRVEQPRLALPSAGLRLSLDAGIGLDEPAPGLHAPEISKDLVADLTKATIGRGKVDRGLVHPYYQQLGKVLLKQWDADRSVSQKGLKGFAESTVENTKAWNKIWLDKAAVYGGSGSPFDVATNGRAKPLNDRLLPGQDLQARREVQREMNKQFKSSRKAEIRVIQDPRGKLLKVELLKPSNDVFVDNEALVDVRAAAEKLPPPPDEVTAGKKNLISTWEFELIVSITPPVPTFSFEFDEAIGFIDVRLPLDRRIYKKVKLLSVD